MLSLVCLASSEYYTGVEATGLHMTSAMSATYWYFIMVKKWNAYLAPHVYQLLELRTKPRAQPGGSSLWSFSIVPCSRFFHAVMNHRFWLKCLFTFEKILQHEHYELGLAVFIMPRDIPRNIFLSFVYSMLSIIPTQGDPRILFELSEVPWTHNMTLGNIPTCVETFTHTNLGTSKFSRMRKKGWGQTWQNRPGMHFYWFFRELSCAPARIAENNATSFLNKLLSGPSNVIYSSE